MIQSVHGICDGDFPVRSTYYEISKTDESDAGCEAVSANSSQKKKAGANTRQARLPTPLPPGFAGLPRDPDAGRQHTQPTSGPS